MRVVQVKQKYGKTWSACFSEAKSQVWLNPKEEYAIRPEGRALVGDKRRFFHILSSNKIWSSVSDERLRKINFIINISLCSTSTLSDTAKQTIHQKV